jgi:hypothetical protein
VVFMTPHVLDGAFERVTRAREHLLDLRQRFAPLQDIEELQPYKGCNWTKNLKSVSNPDKHRELIKLIGEVTATVYVFGEDVEFDDLQLPIHRALHPISGAEVDVTDTILCLSDKTPVMALEEIIVKVTETLNAFKPKF